MQIDRYKRIDGMDHIFAFEFFCDRSAGRAVAGAIGAIFLEQPNSARISDGYLRARLFSDTDSFLQVFGSFV